MYVQKTVPTLKAGVKLSDIVAEQATSSRSWPRSSGTRSLSILTFHQRCVDLRFVMLHKHLMPCLSKVMGSIFFFKLCFLCCDNQLAEYSPEEAYRVLRRAGTFFEYELGPEANKEIRDSQIGSIREFPLLWRFLGLEGGSS